MIKNYFTVAFRSILKNKLNTATNIFGLAVGLSVCLLVLLYVFHEISYEKEVPDAERIYEVYRMDTWNNITTKTARNSPHLAEELKNRMPEIENACEFVPTEFPLIEDGKIKKTISVIESDESFFSLFSIRLLKGSLANALVEPNSIIISEDFAMSLSKNLDVVGKTVILKTPKGNEEFKITGVALPINQLTHLNFEAIISIKNILRFLSNVNTVEWNIIFSYCFIKLGNDHPEQLQKKFPKFMKSYERKDLSLGLLPLLDLHLKSDLNGQLSGTSNIKYIYILISVAVLLLIISNSNFISLTSANYFRRLKEIGVRKTIGAGKKSLFTQFFIENMLIVFFSFFIAFFLTEMLLPDFNNLLKTNLSMSIVENGEAFFLCFLLTFIMGCVTTFYISHLTAKQKSANLISGRILNVNAKSATRKLLITCQFAIAIFLLCCMIIIWQQILFIKHKDLGFNREQVLTIQASGLGNHYKAFINDLKNFPGTKYVSAADWFPGEGIPGTIRYEQNGRNITVRFISIDENFIPSLNIKIKEGRNFDNRLGNESKSWIINRKAVDALGIKDPLNKYVKMSGMEGMVIGIVPDINISSLKESTEPTVFLYIQSEPRLIGIKIQPGKIKQTLQLVQQKWSEYVPFIPLIFSFIDDTLNEQYADDNRLFTASIYSSVLSFIISLLGVFTLTSFIVENKTKEIGIRKVLGATIPSILMMLSKEFIKWIIIANIIAVPIAYYFTNKWLQDFAYRINISWWIFLAAGGIALVIALVTVSFQAIKAATANPVESLKYE